MGVHMLLLGVAALREESAGPLAYAQLLSVDGGREGAHPDGTSPLTRAMVDGARLPSPEGALQPGLFSLFRRVSRLEGRRLPLDYSVECCCQAQPRSASMDEMSIEAPDSVNACVPDGTPARTGPFHLPPSYVAGVTCCSMHEKARVLNTGMFGCGGNFNHGRLADIMQCVNPADMEAATPVAPEVFKNMDVDERELEAAYLLKKLAQGVSTARESLIKEKAATYVDNVLAKHHVHNNEAAGANSEAGLHMDQVTAKTRDALLAVLADSDKGVEEREPLLRRFFELAPVFPYVLQQQRGNMFNGIAAPLNIFTDTANMFVGARDKKARAPSQEASLRDMDQLHPDWRKRLDEVSLYSPLIDAAESCVDTMTEHHERMNHFKIETMMVDEAQIRIYEAEKLWSPADREEKKRAAAAMGNKDFQLLIQIEEAQKMLYQATVEVTDLARELEVRFYTAYARAYWEDLAREPGAQFFRAYAQANYSEFVEVPQAMRSRVQASLDKRGVAWSRRLEALSKSIKVLRNDFEGDMRREAAAAAEDDAKRTWPKRTESIGDWEVHEESVGEWL